MLLNEAKKVLENAGITVQETEVLKGSVRMEGLTLGEGPIRPTIYEPSISNMDEKELIRFANNSDIQAPDINIALLKDREYILKHCISCIRHETDDNTAVKWPAFGDLEEYIRLDLGQNNDAYSMSCVISHDFLQAAGITPEELRIHARKSLKKTATIRSMTEVLQDLMGAQCEDMPMPEQEELMYVATNDTKSHGAAVMLLQDFLNDFCHQHGLDSIYIIPSSLHEVIITSTKIPLQQINDMIQEVNETQVNAWEQLSSHVYTFVAA